MQGIIADRQEIEQRAFNYSDAAAHKNSEDVLVNWGNPKLAVRLRQESRRLWPRGGFSEADYCKRQLLADMRHRS